MEVTVIIDYKAYSRMKRIENQLHPLPCLFDKLRDKRGV